MSDGALLALVAIGALSSTALWAASLVVMVRHPVAHWVQAGHDKRAWAIVQVVCGFSFLGLLSSVAFFIVVWPKLRRAAGRGRFADVPATGDTAERWAAGASGAHEDGECGLIAVSVDGATLLGARRMLIKVDGHVVDRLRAGQSTDLPVTAGRRLVRAHADWLSSPTVQVQVPEGSTVGVRVGCAEDVASLESVLVHPEAAITITVGGASAAGALPSRDQAADMRRAESDQDLDGPFRRSGS